MKVLIAWLLILAGSSPANGQIIPKSSAPTSVPPCICSAAAAKALPEKGEAGRKSTFHIPDAKEILTSVELWAAFFGALAAFLLEAMRRWMEDRRQKVAAGNEAVFALAQMHNLATLINNQLFEDRKKVVRERMQREPLYFEFLPMPVPADMWSKLGLERLGFILAGYNPNLLNKLASIDRGFSALMHYLARRNTQHEEFQRRQATLPKAEVAISKELFEKQIGVDLCEQLRNSTEVLMDGLPKMATQTTEIGKQLTELLSFQFPVARITRFSPTERQDVTAGPDPTAPRWRRLIRGAVTKWRRPTGIPPRERA